MYDSSGASRGGLLEKPLSICATVAPLNFCFQNLKKKFFILCDKQNKDHKFNFPFISLLVRKKSQNFFTFLNRSHTFTVCDRDVTP